MSQLEDEITAFYPYAQQKLGFNKPATVELLSDPDNASKTFGKTAYYSPSANTISVYVDGRHTKDVLRSISHELVHHTQNCRGEFKNAGSTGEGYAQKDPHLRKMEAEAYLMGNGFLFRDYEDQLKKENKKMQLKDAIREAISKVISEREVHEGKSCDEAHPGMSHDEYQQQEQTLALEEVGDSEEEQEELSEAFWPTKDKNNLLNEELIKRWCK